MARFEKLDAEQVWLEQTRAMVDEAEGRLNRLVAQQDEIEAAIAGERRRVDGLRAALGAYLAQAQDGGTLADQLRRWAIDHDGEIIIVQMARALADDGLYPDAKRARWSLEATLGKHRDEFERVERGIWRRRGLRAVDAIGA